MLKRRWGLFFILGILIALGLAWLLIPWRSSPTASRLPPLPQDPAIQVYFNHTETANYPDPYRGQTRPGDNLEQVMIEAINSAQSSLEIAVQEFRLPKLAAAIVDRKKAGVKVRVILENLYSRPSSSFTSQEVAKLAPRERQRYQEVFQLIDQNQDQKLSPQEINQGDVLVMFKNATIPVLDDTADGSKGSGLMHHKFIVIDGKTSIITSANFTTSDIHGDFRNPGSLGNLNNLLKIESSQVSTVLLAEFNLMWGDGVAGKPDSLFGIQKPPHPEKTFSVGKGTVTIRFSPTSPTQPWQTSSNGFISQTLETAQKEVDLALFVFSDQEIANTLEKQHQKGVKIKALIDSDFFSRPYSEAMDMLGIELSTKCQIEANNKPWQNPISSVGVPVLPKGDLLHHKFAIIDGNQVITGSHNWSEAANTNNDETLVIVNNLLVAAHFQREFSRIYQTAVLGVSERVKTKTAQEKQQCANITRKVAKDNPVDLGVIVNINTASLAELESLPGVGKKLAQRIIIERQKQPFRSVEELDRVPGVGKSLIEKLRDRVTF